MQRQLTMTHLTSSVWGIKHLMGSRIHSVELSNSFIHNTGPALSLISDTTTYKSNLLWRRHQTRLIFIVPSSSSCWLRFLNSMFSLSFSVQNLTKQKVRWCEGKLSDPRGFYWLYCLFSSPVSLLICHPNYSLLTCIYLYIMILCIWNSFMFPNLDYFCALVLSD